MKILIVDDNPFILKVIVRMLEGRKYDIHTRENVADAIAFFGSGKSCDILITDIVMPESDGTKLVSFVKQHQSTIPATIPVLAITGGIENAVQDYMHYAEMFADEVMQKPLKKDELIEAIERLVKKARQVA